MDSHQGNKKNMQGYNQGLAFYRHYYEPETWDFAAQCPKDLSASDRANKTKRADSQKAYFKTASAPILEQTFEGEENTLGGYAYEDIQADQLDRSIVLETIYPGLLLGSGYAHGVGDAQGEYKIGFYFDHTTGLPIIPGSSVKGTLRSVFPSRCKDEIDRSNRYEYLHYLLTDPEIGINLQMLEPDQSFINALEREIFDGLVGPNSDQQLAMPSRDVFHDAILTGPAGNAFLGNDFITPHNKAGDYVPATLRNPIPIQFLKVLPGIHFTFQFYLPTRQHYRNQRTLQLVERTDRLLNHTQKIRLFKAILLDIGIGAKTNVGYGQFMDPNAPAPAPRASAHVGQMGHAQQVNEAEKEKSENSKQKPVVVKEVDSNKEDIKPEFFRGNLNYKKRLLMDAQITKSGKPNEIEVFMQTGVISKQVLTNYPASLAEGTVIQVYVQIKKDHGIHSLSFHKVKK